MKITTMRLITVAIVFAGLLSGISGKDGDSNPLSKDEIITSCKVESCGG